MHEDSFHYIVAVVVPNKYSHLVSLDDLHCIQLYYSLISLIENLLDHVRGKLLNGQLLKLIDEAQINLLTVFI